jgi:hypothetical protein
MVTQLEADALKAAESLLAQMLRDATPALEQMLVQYATKFIAETIQGHIPLKLSAPQQQPADAIIGTQKQYTSHPAVNAATTTMFRGLSLDALAAVANVLGTLSGIDFFSKQGWMIIGGLVGKTVIQTVWKFFSTRKAMNA